MKEVCIVYAGTKFSTDYVVQKRRQLDKHSSKPARLTVLTDDPATIMGLGLRDTRAAVPARMAVNVADSYGIKFIYPSCRKIKLKKEFKDLDTVIIHDIVHLYKHEPDSFMILQDFNRAFIQSYPISNSSVMRFDPRDHHSICEYFEQNP